MNNLIFSSNTILEMNVYLLISTHFFQQMFGQLQSVEYIRSQDFISLIYTDAFFIVC